MQMSASEWNEQALSLLRKAVLAPSSHNTQPWLFRIGTSEIDLFADRTRALPVNDPEDRELAISCGAALMNLRVAAAHHGYRVQVQLLPDAGEPDWIARATMSREPGEPSTVGALADFMEVRRTYRKRFAKREVDSATVDQLVDAAGSEGAWLRPLLAEEARQRAATLVAGGDAAQWADPSWRRELAAWMRPRRRGDGLTVPTPAAPVAQLVIRTFDMGLSVGGKDRELAESSPLLAVLGTKRDNPHDWVQAGEALQRVLLTACQHGLQASHLNQPIQVASLRPKLRHLVGTGFPQLLLRFGYPVEGIPGAPRRPVEDVTRAVEADGP
jgi:nitroreductase